MYHGRVPLRTIPEALNILVLEPPGNEARELARYKRRLFAEGSGDAALAFPEAVPLALTFPLGRREALFLLEAVWKGFGAALAERGAFARGAFARGDAARGEIARDEFARDEIAKGLQFRAERLVERSGGLYLRLEPEAAAEALSAAARAALSSLKAAAPSRAPAREKAKTETAMPFALRESPWILGLGFPLTRARRSEGQRSQAAAYPAAQDMAQNASESERPFAPPCLSFRDADLVLYTFVEATQEAEGERESGPVHTAFWSERARLKRKTGARKKA